MTLVLMTLYGILALSVLGLAQLAMVGIVAAHRNFVARHEAVTVSVKLDAPDISATA